MAPELTEAAKTVLADATEESDIIITRTREQLGLYREKGLLEGWVVEVVPWPGMDAVMSVNWADGYRYVQLRVNTDNADVKKMDWLFRYFVLHEICHLMLAPFQDALEANVKLDSAMYELFRYPIETATDNVARALWTQLEGENIYDKIH